MTTVYFVRHAQPEHRWEDDRTRPLTEEGRADSKIVLDFLRDKNIDAFYCSPYKRSMDTIADAAAYFGKEIITDERLRERQKGLNGNQHGMFEKRWNDHDYHEENGESIRMVQERNIAALSEILAYNKEKIIVIGTHGTALSTILNFYNSDFGCKDFLRIIDWMPYIIELDFEAEALVSIKEHCYIEKVFQGENRADKINRNKSELLFYDTYEDFYAMARTSNAFKAFCIDAFGQDFSQDGFSDIHQIDLVLQYVPTQDEVHILDIGCGNGKMLGYLQKKTGAYIYGFDYSEQAIQTAQALFSINAEFKEGVIGEADYPEETFDLIISMDTMYFAKDMTAFVAQVKKWLRPNGVFFVGYQEGDVMPKTRDSKTTVLSDALDKNGMIYEVTDITRQTYDMLQLKRKSALTHQTEFEAEGYKNWFDMLMLQTECILEPFEQFKEKMARYIYVIRK